MTLNRPASTLGSVKYCLHFLLREGVARLLQLFRDVGGIPGLEVGEAQFVLGEGAQFGHVLLGEGLGLGRHVAQEGEHLLRRVGHLGHQRDFGEIAEAEHLASSARSSRMRLISGPLSHSGLL
jgi:hypothetical protein